MTKWLLFLFNFHLFYCQSNGQGGKELICENQSRTITCNNTYTIQIQTVHFGRFTGIICLGEEFITSTCNGSVDARRYVVNSCENRTSCTLTFNQVYGNCDSDLEPYAEVHYDCVGNETFPQISDEEIPGNNTDIEVILYSLLGAVALIAIIVAVVCIIRRRISLHGSSSSVKLTDDNKNHQSQSTTENPSRSVRGVIDDSHYDEISIHDETMTTVEYNHLKFKRSTKTMDSGAYSHAVGGTYNHATVDFKPMKSTEYDSSKSFNVNNTTDNFYINST